MNGPISKVAKAFLLTGAVSASALRVPAYAQDPQPASYTFVVPSRGVTFLTGDSWQQAGTHLGQRSCASATTGRTYERKRSDQNHHNSSCKEGAVHICPLPDSAFFGRDHLGHLQNV